MKQLSLLLLCSLFLLIPSCGPTKKNETASTPVEVQEVPEAVEVEEVVETAEQPSPPAPAETPGSDKENLEEADLVDVMENR